MLIKRFAAILVAPLLIGCEMGSDEKVGQEGGFMADTLVDAMGTSDVAVLPPPATDTAAPAAAGGMQTIPFTPVGDPVHSGSVMIHPMAEQTQIAVSLSGPQAGVHQGHIHTGTCQNIGSVVQPLEPVNVPQGAQGTSTSNVSIPPATVMNGQHIVVYHTAGGTPGQPVVCAAIPQAAA